MTKKLSIELVYNSFISEGYTLLSTEYINAKTKLEYICPNGHQHRVSWADWKTGYRCSYCAGNGRLTIEVVREEFKQRGFELLDIKYVNSKQSFNYKCTNGHINSMRIDHLRL